MKNLEINTIITQIAIGLVLVIAIFILTIVSTIDKKMSSDNTKSQELEDKKSSKKEFKTTGKHLNKLYMYSVYVIVFSIIAIFIMLSFFALGENTALFDIWPFIFIVGTTLFCSLLIIDKSKVHSKRTVQRDMREI